MFGWRELSQNKRSCRSINGRAIATCHRLQAFFRERNRNRRSVGVILKLKMLSSFSRLDRTIFGRWSLRSREFVHFYFNVNHLILCLSIHRIGNGSCRFDLLFFFKIASLLCRLRFERKSCSFISINALLRQSIFVRVLILLLRFSFVWSVNAYNRNNYR